MKNLPRTFPEGWNCPYLVGTSANVLQTLCVSWAICSTTEGERSAELFALEQGPKVSGHLFLFTYPLTA